jgi:hypothetical protein
MFNKRKSHLVLLCSVLAVSSPAYAYLDPGTGNILIYAIISILGSLFYVAKTVSYKILKVFGLSKGNESHVSGHQDLVLFSEGKSYWLTFKPVVEALIAKRQPFTYYTMDIEDPALTIEDDYMNSRYVGTAGVRAFAKVCNVRAKVMLATTPNIGTPGYPMPIPQYVDCLAHVLHGVGDIGMYHKYSLDGHHTALMMGDFSLTAVRHLEKLRGLPEKEFVAVGMPYLDELAKLVEPKEQQSQPPVILIAPSWGSKGCLSVWGAEFIESLAKANYHIIVRPHPHTIKSEPALLAKVKQQLAPYANIEFDELPDGSRSMNRADLLISDKSGIRFDFAFLYQRPVITLDMAIPNPELYELSDLEYIWEDDIAAKIGPVIALQDMPNIVEITQQALAIKPQQIKEIRDRDIKHFGHSGEAIADWAINKIKTLGM